MCAVLWHLPVKSADHNRDPFLKFYLTSIYSFSCLCFSCRSLFVFVLFVSPFLKTLPPLPPVPFPFSSFSCLLAAAAGGDMTARRATATGGTNTRRARGARKAKRPARTTMQTKKTRMPWSSDHHLCLSFGPSLALLSLSTISVIVRNLSTEDEKRRHEWYLLSFCLPLDGWDGGGKHDA